MVIDVGASMQETFSVVKDGSKVHSSRVEVEVDIPQMVAGPGKGWGDAGVFFFRTWRWVILGALTSCYSTHQRGVKSKKCLDRREPP